MTIEPWGGTAVPGEEFERRFKARIVSELMKPLSEEEIERAKKADPDWTPWTTEEAEAVAEDQWDSVDFDEHYSGFESDPEGAADEELSYWGD